jgi:anti-sigma regulatory factor (Ser/Thr protein kinase)
MSAARIHESRLTFRSTVEAPALGRQALSDALGDVPARTVQDAQLLLTEVMTNAIRHAGLGNEDVISVRIRDLQSRVEVEVSNAGSAFDPTMLRPRSAEAGWGLLLLDRIAEEWGVREGPRGEVAVWFRLRRDDV